MKERRTKQHVAQKDYPKKPMTCNWENFFLVIERDVGKIAVGWQINTKSSPISPPVMRCTC